MQEAGSKMSARTLPMRQTKVESSARLSHQHLCQILPTFIRIDSPLPHSSSMKLFCTYSGINGASYAAYIETIHRNNKVHCNAAVKNGGVSSITSWQCLTKQRMVLLFRRSIGFRPEKYLIQTVIFCLDPRVFKRYSSDFFDESKCTRFNFLAYISGSTDTKPIWICFFTSPRYNRSSIPWMYLDGLLRRSVSIRPCTNWCSALSPYLWSIQLVILRLRRFLPPRTWTISNAMPVREFGCLMIFQYDSAVDHVSESLVA